MADASKAQQWAKRIAEFESSGLNRRTWCRQRGVSPNTLDYWRRRLRVRSTALVPIVVAGDDKLSPTVEIALSDGTRVRTPCGVDTAWLSALVRGLSGC